MAARLLAGRDQVKAAVLDALELALGDARLRRIALVVGGVDQKQRRRDLVQSWGWIVGGGALPGIDEVVGVSVERRGEAVVDQLVGLFARGGELLIGQRAAARGRGE